MSPLPIRAFLLLGLAGVQGAPAVAPAAPVAGQTAPPQADSPAPQAEPASAPEPRRVDLLFEGALVGARDAQDFAETPGYRRLVESVASYAEEDLHARAQRQLDIPSALADPDAWRGEFVHLRAQLGDIRAVRLATPLRGSVDVFRAFLTDGEDGVVVDFLNPPPELRLRKDVVEVEGVFFRTLRYENKKGDFKEAPYLIARGLTRPDEAALPRRTVVDSLMGWAVLLAGGLFLVVRIGMLVRSANKKTRGIDDVRASRTLRQHAMAPLRGAPASKKPPTPHPKH